MPEALGAHAKQRRWLTAAADCMGDLLEALRPQRAAKQSQMQRASEWLQDSRKGLWRAFIVGSTLVAGKCCLGLPNNDLEGFRC